VVATGQATQRMGRALLVLVACAAALAGGCSDDDDSAPDEETSTPTTQPPGTDPDAVEPIVEDLLARYDEIVNEIMLDQSVVTDRESEIVQDYLGVFEPDSDAAAQALDGWENDTEAGLSFAPSEAGGRAVVSRLDGEVDTVSDDEVRFPTCDEQNFDILDASGGVTDHVESDELPGEGVAVRVDGQWYLRELTLGDGEGCGIESEGT